MISYSVARTSQQFISHFSRVCTVHESGLGCTIITVSKSQWKGIHEQFRHAGVWREVSYLGGVVLIMVGGGNLSRILDGVYYSMLLSCI